MVLLSLSYIFLSIKNFSPDFFQKIFLQFFYLKNFLKIFYKNIFQKKIFYDIFNRKNFLIVKKIFAQKIFFI
nr:MAG TPA: hypothetical protein [Caudoviricetes sp.]